MLLLALLQVLIRLLKAVSIKQVLQQLVAELVHVVCAQHALWGHQAGHPSKGGCWLGQLQGRQADKLLGQVLIVKHDIQCILELIYRVAGVL